MAAVFILGSAFLTRNRVSVHSTPKFYFLTVLSRISVVPVRSLKKYYTQLRRGCLRGVMVKAMDCGIVVREFVLQSRYYIHFRANTLGKGMNPLILPAMG